MWVSYLRTSLWLTLTDHIIDLIIGVITPVFRYIYCIEISKYLNIFYIIIILRYTNLATETVGVPVFPTWPGLATPVRGGGAGGPQVGGGVRGPPVLQQSAGQPGRNTEVRPETSHQLRLGFLHQRDRSGLGWDCLLSLSLISMYQILNYDQWKL